MTLDFASVVGSVSQVAVGGGARVSRSALVAVVIWLSRRVIDRR